MDPARMFKESLTPRPELENSQDPERTSVRSQKAAFLTFGSLARLRNLVSPRGEASKGRFAQYVGQFREVSMPAHNPPFGPR
jgi:hypothetical protein